ncbi:hypothetical protein K438DRAFT_1761093 [Mycena galopus ATCC 62051]|nr:hypothetical protein K438DRAFT_1761093 [Mycena galopus ATCC 62051]
MGFDHRREKEGSCLCGFPKVALPFRKVVINIGTSANLGKLPFTSDDLEFTRQLSCVECHRAMLVFREGEFYFVFAAEKVAGDAIRQLPRCRERGLCFESRASKCLAVVIFPFSLAVGYMHWTGAEIPESNDLKMADYHEIELNDNTDLERESDKGVITTKQGIPCTTDSRPQAKQNRKRGGGGDANVSLADAQLRYEAPFREYWFGGRVRGHWCGPSGRSIDEDALSAGNGREFRSWAGSVDAETRREGPRLVTSLRRARR